MNVLIADDEEDVLLGLKKIIHWEKLGFTVCGDARNGEETLQKIRVYDPELVLLDIRMPQYTGFEIIERARETGYHGQFIILSGYSDFTYAQKAVGLGVSDYLVKPVDEDDLAAAVVKVRDGILQQQSMENKLSQYRENAKGEILMRLMKGLTPSSVYDLSDLSLAADQYMVVFYEKYNKEIIRLSWELREILASSVKNAEKMIDSVLIDGAEYLLLKGTSIIQRFHRLLEHYQTLPETGSPLDCIFLIYGRAVTSLDELPSSFADVKKLQSRRFFCTPFQHVLSYAELPDPEAVAQLPSVDTLSEHLTSCILAHNRYKLAEELEKLENALFVSHAEEKVLRQMLVDLFLQIKQQLIRSDFQTDALLPANSAVIHAMEQKDYLYEIIQYFSEQLNLCSCSCNSDIITDILYYIDHNYEKPLKLETLAPLFGYSSSYLGKFFARKTGESFNTYLDRVRIRHAASMIARENLHIYEISERVGYRNVDYFYKKFRKYTNMTPLEYREQAASTQHKPNSMSLSTDMM